MGDWYTIGLALGLGLAIGVLLAGLLSATPLGRGAAVVLAAAAGALAGVVIDGYGASPAYLVSIGGGVLALVGALATRTRPVTASVGAHG